MHSGVGCVAVMMQLGQGAGDVRRLLEGGMRIRW